MVTGGIADIAKYFYRGLSCSVGRRVRVFYEAKMEEFKRKGRRKRRKSAESPRRRQPAAEEFPHALGNIHSPPSPADTRRRAHLLQSPPS